MLLVVNRRWKSIGDMLALRCVRDAVELIVSFCREINSPDEATRVKALDTLMTAVRSYVENGIDTLLEVIGFAMKVPSQAPNKKLEG